MLLYALHLLCAYIKFNLVVVDIHFRKYVKICKRQQINKKQ